MNTRGAIESLGTLVTTKILEDAGDLIITTSELDEEGKLCIRREVRIGPNQFPQIGNSKFQAVSVKSICFEELGLIIPCVLAVLRRTRNLKQDLIIFAFLDGNVVYEKILKLPTFIDKQPSSPFPYELEVSDGPTVVLYDKCGLDLYICAQAEPSFKKVSWDITGLSIDNFTKSGAFCTVAKNVTGRSYLILEFKDPNLEKVTYYALKISPDGSIERADVCSDSHNIDFPYRDYWPILTAFETAECNCYHNEDSLSMSDEQQNIVLFATSSSQFLACRAFDTIACCQIPFDDCNTIEYAELPNNENVAVLTSKSSQCCLVSIRQSTVLQYWHHIHQAFVGDFCHTGHDQVLISFNDVDDTSGFDFFLTDLHCCQKGRALSSSYTDGNDQVQMNLAAVTKALSSNLQALALEKDQSMAMFERKSDLITDSWKNLKRMSLGMDQKVNSNHDLLPLNGETKRHSNDCSTNNTADEPFEVLEKNQYVMLDNWVVSLKLKSNLKRTLRNVSLSLLVEGQTSQGTVVPVLFAEHDAEKSNRNTDHSSKASVEPGATHVDSIFTLTAKTDVPFARFDRPAEAVLFVNWHDGDCEGDVPGYSCCVGNCRLDAGEFALGMYLPDKVSNINEVYELIEIEVHCQFGSLAHLPMKLQESRGVLKCGVFVNEACKAPREIPNDSNGQLFIIMAKSKMSAEIDIYARSSFEASQILAVVISMLPKGTTTRLPQRKYTELFGKLKHGLLEELEILEAIIKAPGSSNKASLAREDHDVEMDIDTVNPERYPMTSAKESVERARASFGRKRKRAELMMQNAASIEVKPSDYKKYLRAVQQTNSVAELLTMLR